MKFLSFVLVYVLALTCVHAQRIPGPPKPVAPQNWGKVEDGKFSSPRLGLTVSIPAEYTIISSAEAEILGAAGADVLKQGGAIKSIDEALHRTIQLLAIAEYPVGTPKNAALEIVAVQQQPGATAKMSLAANVMVLKGTPFVLKKSLGSVKIGANRYEGAELEGEFSGIIIKQRMYVVMQKGFSIAVVIVYSTDQQITDMLRILSTLSLSK